MEYPATSHYNGLDIIILANSTRGLSRVVEPATILRWHRAGFRSYWRWKSRGRAGRPRIEQELRELIQRMSKKNPLWGAPRIHGELLKLGFEVADETRTHLLLHKDAPRGRAVQRDGTVAAVPILSGLGTGVAPVAFLTQIKESHVERRHCWAAHTTGSGELPEAA